MSQLPPEVERRRRLITRTLPLAAVAVASFVIGAAVGAPGSPEKDSASRFAEAWASGSFDSMYRQLNDESRRRLDERRFVAAYRDADRVATLRALRPGEPGEPRDRGGATVVPVPFTVETVAFGSFEATLELPLSGGGVAWDPSLVLPGLRPGERLESRTELAPRAAILARDGTPLATGPATARRHPLGSAAIDVTGEVGSAPEDEYDALAGRGFTPDTPVGVSGLEKAFNARLSGRPGGTLSAVPADGGEPRLLASAQPTPGEPVRTTIDPELQEAAVSALAGRAGGIAALDARSGDVRALAGQAFSAPQPPGSTFKLVTTTAALQKGLVELDDRFEVTEGVHVGGRFIHNANGELCGGSFSEAFAHSCNAVFAPLGPLVGNDDLVRTAERFGFNSPPTLYGPRYTRAMELPESTIPEQIGAEIDLAVSAIGQGEVMATPLEMASVAQTIANGGLRRPTSVVANRELRPRARPVRVMSKRIARELTGLMVGVVEDGTGYAAAIPEAQVAGKTGTAELGPKPGEENSDNPVQIKDAWFAAFAPAKKPRLAIAVLLIEAEASGGEVAAPAAGSVLAAGL